MLLSLLLCFLFYPLVNDIRKTKNLPLLQIIQVDFIIADSVDPNIKLSSTLIRSLIDT
jgi:phosphopantetheine adenylyltransferase